MSNLSTFAKHIAKVLNDANTAGDLEFPSGVQAQFKAVFNQDVENLQNVSIFVCPHSMNVERLTRTSSESFITMDVAIRYKYPQTTPEEVVEEYGELADSIAHYLNGLDLFEPYHFHSMEYYPYHADSLEQIRTFVSVISIKYKTYQGYWSRT